MFPTYSEGTSKTQSWASFWMERHWMFWVSSPLFASVTVIVTPPLHNIYLCRDLPTHHMLLGYSFSETTGLTIEECTSTCDWKGYSMGGEVANGDECCKCISCSFLWEVQFHNSLIFWSPLFRSQIVEMLQIPTQSLNPRVAEHHALAILARIVVAQIS